MQPLHLRSAFSGTGLNPAASGQCASPRYMQSTAASAAKAPAAAPAPSMSVDNIGGMWVFQPPDVNMAQMFPAGGGANDDMKSQIDYSEPGEPRRCVAQIFSRCRGPNPR